MLGHSTTGAPLLAVLAGLTAGMGNASALGVTKELGNLTCSVAEEPTTDTAAMGQSRAVHCLFRFAGTGLEETYTGTLLSAADPQRVVGRGAMTWVVRAPPQAEERAGLLEQTYTAVPADAEQASPPLVAEGRSPLSLQPLRQHDLPLRGPLIVLAIDLKLATSVG